MHELSIALNIVEIAHEQVIDHDANEVEKIELEIGTMSGIEMDAFLFVWDEAVSKSVLENAERVIHTIEAKAKCSNCSNQFALEERFQACPVCGEYLSELLQGEELKVRTLVLI